MRRNYLTMIIVIMVVFITGCLLILGVQSIQQVSGEAVHKETVFYVSTNGDDSNPGNITQPWRTIQKAADTVRPGDTVYVRGGKYNERVKMKTSGQADAVITFNNYPNEIPVIDGTGMKLQEDEENNALFLMKDVSFIQLKGIHLTNLTSTNEFVPAGIRVIGAGEHIQILNCQISHIRTTYNKKTGDRHAYAIAIHGTNGERSLNHLTIDGCEVFDNVLGGSETVALNGNITNFQVTNNKIHDNDNIGIDFIGFEGTAPKNDQVRDGVCTDNEIWNISSAENGVYHDVGAGGIYVDGGKNIKIERNKVWNSDIGIEIASEHAGKTVENILVSKNFIYGCQEVAGIAFGGYDEKRGSAKHIRIMNNTLYKNEPHILVQSHSQDTTNEIINNNFYHGTNIVGNTDEIMIKNNFNFSGLLKLLVF